MAPNALSTLIVALTIASSYVAAQQTLSWAATPLIDQMFPEPSNAPNQVYPASQPYTRGPQTGTNICNSTTEGQSSDCQTAYFNSINDFCIWAPPDPNTSISDSEGEEVAWCTLPGHGTRVIPPGTFKGFQLLQNNDYWMITGNLEQTLINIRAGDAGGELDSGGQDGRGNPIGGLMYSAAFGRPAPYQINWWTEFIGNDQFCMKICNPNGNNNPGYCQHTLDEIGLAYNCPSKYTISGYADGEFEVCQSDDIGVPGIYVSDGVTYSYSQPPESLGPITTIPYQPTTVASSSCTTYASSDLFIGSASSYSYGPYTSTSSASGTATTTTSSDASTATRTATTTRRGSSTSAGSSPTGSSGHSGAVVNTVSVAALVIVGLGSFVLLG